MFSRTPQEQSPEPAKPAETQGNTSPENLNPHFLQIESDVQTLKIKSLHPVISLAGTVLFICLGETHN